MAALFLAWTMGLGSGLFMRAVTNREIEKYKRDIAFVIVIIFFMAAAFCLSAFSRQEFLTSLFELNEQTISEGFVFAMGASVGIIASR